MHIRLWHREFWLMAITNFLLTMSVYMLLPTMPRWLLTIQDFSPLETGIAMAAFGVGLFVFGMFVSFLVERYRRNEVCIWAVIAVGALIGLLYYLDAQQSWFCDLGVIIAQRFALGAAFGLAQMVLTSTLIIDTSESFLRTEANYSAAWFSRFALSLGPMVGLLLERIESFRLVLLASIACSVVSILLILMVHFPFRAPQDEIPTVSLDRFFLPHGFPLFVNLQLIMLAAGILFSMRLTEQFYAMMMVGFLVALLAQRFVFRDAEMKSEVVSGLILMVAAFLMLLTRTQEIVFLAAPVFIGLGLGIIGSRFLLFFIKLSHHCQRGTSQSTFLLGWESGIAWGLGIGFAFFSTQPMQALVASLVLVALALLMYNFTHNWFMEHKNR